MAVSQRQTRNLLSWPWFPCWALHLASHFASLNLNTSVKMFFPLQVVSLATCPAHLYWVRRYISSRSVWCVYTFQCLTLLAHLSKNSQGSSLGLGLHLMTCLRNPWCTPLSCCSCLPVRLREPTHQRACERTVWRKLRRLVGEMCGLVKSSRFLLKAPHSREVTCLSSALASLLNVSVTPRTL